MGDTTRRRQAIRDLVTRQRVKTQSELVRLLGDSGVPATQASVSRDIRALGLLKVNGAYAPPDQAVGTVALEKGLAGRIRSVRRAGECMVVLRTDPGGAGMVALAIDGARWEAVAGTVAGDDTVLIVCDGATAQRELLDGLSPFLPSSVLVKSPKGKGHKT